MPHPDMAAPDIEYDIAMACAAQMFSFDGEAMLFQ
jgi:hypothetical protein